MATDAGPFSKQDLSEALRAIDSTISKCEKVRPKLKEGTPQHSLLTRRLKALHIAAACSGHRPPSGYNTS